MGHALELLAAWDRNHLTVNDICVMTQVSRATWYLLRPLPLATGATGPPNDFTGTIDRSMINASNYYLNGRRILLRNILPE